MITDVFEYFGETGDDPGTSFAADVIHPWEMTITRLDGAYPGKFALKLAGRPFLAVGFQAISAVQARHVAFPATV